MKKATRHRKRIAPPGPCGVLWQMQRRSRDDRKKPNSTASEQNLGNPSSTVDNESALREEEIEESLDPFSNRNHEDSSSIAGIQKNKVQDDENLDGSTPPAWTAMQRSLRIVTPYLPVQTQGDVRKRYELLRPHLPQKCITLLEILKGQYDLQIRDPSLYLCAWVDTIDERNAHHGIWTILLRDETGATVRAWMEPDFCKRELQKAQEQQTVTSPVGAASTSDPTGNMMPVNGVIRTGVVWMLQKFSLFPIKHPTNDSTVDGNTVERMLVISGKHIRRVWTPEDHRAQNQPNEEDDSPEAQREYINWMEQRKALVVAIDDEQNDENICNANGSQIPEESPRLEKRDILQSQSPRCHFSCDDNRLQKYTEHRTEDPSYERDNGSCRGFVGGTQHKESIEAMSELTMTADEVIARGRTSENCSTIATFPHALHDCNTTDDAIHQSIDDNNNNGHNNQPPSALQTQNSLPGIFDDKDYIKKVHGRDFKNVQASIELEEKFDSQRHHGESNPKVTLHDKQKAEHKRERTSSRSKSPRTKKKLHRTVNPDGSPCRKETAKLLESIWNTPDPSIIALLERQEVNDEDSDEVETVICDNTGLSSSLLFKSSQISNSYRSSDQAEGSSYPKPKPIVDGMASQRIATAFFEPSSWEGIDIERFNDEDS